MSKECAHQAIRYYYFSMFYVFTNYSNKMFPEFNLQVKMETLANEYGQRVMPHFASYNAHEIKASQDAALKYSVHKEESDHRSVLSKHHPLDLEKHSPRHSPPSDLLLQQQERDRELRENRDPRLLTPPKSHHPSGSSLSSLPPSHSHHLPGHPLHHNHHTAHQHPPHPHHHHPLGPPPPHRPQPQHAHPHHTSRGDDESDDDLRLQHRLAGSSSSISASAGSRPAWQPLYLSSELAAQHPPPTSPSYRDREPLTVSSHSDSSRSSLKSLSAGYSSNPEIRVSSPRGRSASPVIGHRRQREYSPLRLRHPSPPMMAMNLVKTPTSSSSSSSSSFLPTSNNPLSIHSLSRPSPLPSPVPRSSPPSSSSSYSSSSPGTEGGDRAEGTPEVNRHHGAG